MKELGHRPFEAGPVFRRVHLVSKKADWKLVETIGFLPRRRHGIRPVPEALTPIYTGGRGGLEACLMNTYNLPARPLYTLAALTPRSVRPPPFDMSGLPK